MIRPRPLLTAVMLVALGLSFAPRTFAADAAPPPERKLTVFAAASLSEAFNEIGRALKKSQGIDVTFNFAGSQQLASQIEQGAAADLFASADMRWMDYLQQRGLTAATDTVFCHNRLVAIVPKSNPARIQALTDLARAGVKVVLAAQAVPVGEYSRECLHNLSHRPEFGDDFATRVLRNLVSEEENVKSVVGKVQLGEADAGVVYRSDVTPPVSRYVRVFDIPDSANVVASYPIAVLKASRRPQEAKAFVDLVLSESGQRTLERWGFLARSSSP